MMYLDSSNSTVNLDDKKERQSLLGSDQRAVKYACGWHEVLIFWNVPSKAIVSSVIYYITKQSNKIYFLEYPNPNYDSSRPPTKPTHEDFADEDNQDRSRYPNF